MMKSVPPDDLRCRRSDGKQWRCKGYKVDGKSMCVKHLPGAKISSATVPVVKPRRKYIARDDTSDDDDDSRVSLVRTVKKVRRKYIAGDDTLTMMKDENEEQKPYGKDDGEVAGEGDKKKYKSARAESSSKEKDRIKTIKHGDGQRSDKVSRVVKKRGVGLDFNKSRLKGKIKEIQCHEEKNDGKLYDSKRKLLKPIATGVENEPLLGRNDRNLREKKRVKVALEKQEYDHQDDCTDTKGKENGEAAIRSDKGKNKKVDKRRKHFSTDDSYDDCQMCHQCMKSDRKVVRCIKRCGKRYCSPCIERWYPHLSDEAITEKCPVCRGNCNCKDCLRKNIIPKEAKYLGIPCENNEQINCLKYLVNALYPFLKTFIHDQTIEKETEATIKGLSLTRLKIPKAAVHEDERVYCNNCSTSIVDLHSGNLLSSSAQSPRKQPSRIS